MIGHWTEDVSKVFVFPTLWLERIYEGERELRIITTVTNYAYDDRYDEGFAGFSKCVVPGSVWCGGERDCVVRGKYGVSHEVWCGLWCIRDVG